MKFDRNQGVLLLYWMQTFEEIIGRQNRPFTDALFINLQILHTIKDIHVGHELPIFTDAVTKGLKIMLDDFFVLFAHFFIDFVYNKWKCSNIMANTFFFECNQIFNIIILFDIDRSLPLSTFHFTSKDFFPPFAII